ncbi:MAG: hypothetical protein ACLUNZ_11185 [Evtepia sp.]
MSWAPRRDPRGQDPHRQDHHLRAGGRLHHPSCERLADEGAEG